jgi:hypothetical protein
MVDMAAILDFSADFDINQYYSVTISDRQLIIGSKFPEKCP